MPGEAELIGREIGDVGVEIGEAGFAVIGEHVEEGIADAPVFDFRLFLGGELVIDLVGGGGEVEEVELAQEGQGVGLALLFEVDGGFVFLVGVEFVLEVLLEEVGIGDVGAFELEGQAVAQVVLVADGEAAAGVLVGVDIVAVDAEAVGAVVHGWRRTAQEAVVIVAFPVGLDAAGRGRACRNSRG